ncbi:MAG TPA: cupin domain-containing protein [Alphaproteobacteria bacterium]|nr:cupin domain-containing protein [Alphaproteobacteria bacterium]
MAKPVTSLADILAPVTTDEFLADIRYRRPVHIKGDPDKFAGVMSWQSLTDLVNRGGIWTSNSMQLVLDHRRLEPQEYCAPEMGRDKQQVMAPDLGRVRSWLRQGASMILNDIDGLTPGLKAAAKALEEALTVKVQANLYCSWEAHPGFGSHFDTHEVFALHVAGRKTWRIYGRHFEDPISHPAFRSLGQEFHDRHKGPVTQEVTLEPGDLLYIPRGWYHDAIATSEATMHVAFGATGPIGLDLLTPLFERAVQDPLFRRNVPTGDRAALAAHMAALGERLAGVARDGQLVEAFAAFADNYRFNRDEIALPGDALTRRYRRAPFDMKLAKAKGQIVLTDGKRGVPVPPGAERPIQWVLGQERDFAETDFAAAFPKIPDDQRGKLLRDLAAMEVIQPA